LSETPYSASWSGGLVKSAREPIPKDAIAELVSARGIPELLDSIKVNHVSGGQSVIGLKKLSFGPREIPGRDVELGLAR
jgi:hypothetical protein